MLEQAVAAGIAEAGGEALLGGVLPTPAAPLLIGRYGWQVIYLIGGALTATVLAVNVADDADHRRLRRLRREVQRVLPVVAAVGPLSYAEGRGSGNAILLASRGDRASRAAARLLQAGPHPVAAVADRDVVPVEVAVEVDP